MSTVNGAGRPWVLSGILLNINQIAEFDKFGICLGFDSNMHGKEFTIEFTMGDGLAVTATFETPASLHALGESGLGEEPSYSEDSWGDCPPEECQLQQ